MNKSVATQCGECHLKIIATIQISAETFVLLSQEALQVPMNKEALYLYSMSHSLPNPAFL